jgi:hypothetical protein
MAKACLSGKGVPKDERKAFELTKEAAAMGHAEALGTVGYFYHTGMVVEKDERQAVEWFRKGAEAGSAKARFNLGKVLLEWSQGSAPAAAGADGHPADPAALRAEGLQWIAQAAEGGLAEAARSYGFILYFGDHGVAQDAAKAAPFLRLAADHGIADAQNAVGAMCELGHGMPLDFEGAKHWYRAAAQQGNPKAQGNLGRLLYGPAETDPKIQSEALAWLLLAIDNGDVAAVKAFEDLRPGLKAVDVEAARTRAEELRQSIHKKTP